MRPQFFSAILVQAILIRYATYAGGVTEVSPPAEEQQLPRAMHSLMKERPRLTVGPADADIIGSDNRALQAGKDFLWGLGGGAPEGVVGGVALWACIAL